MARGRLGLGGSGWEVASGLLPVVLDAAHLAVFEPLNALLRGLLAAPGPLAVVVLAGAYLGWLVTLALVGTLAPEAPPPTLELTTRAADRRTTTTRTTWPRLVFFYPSLLFGVLLVMLIVRATGDLDAPAVPAGLQDLALGAAVLLFFAHVVVAAVDVTPRHPPTGRAHFVVLVPVLVVGELVLNLATAAWLHLFGVAADAAPADVAAAAARSGGELAVALLLFLPVFAGPRFTALARSFTLTSLASGLALVVWEVWGTLDRVAL